MFSLWFLDSASSKTPITVQLTIFWASTLLKCRLLNFSSKNGAQMSISGGGRIGFGSFAKSECFSWFHCVTWVWRSAKNYQIGYENLFSWFGHQLSVSRGTVFRAWRLFYPGMFHNSSNVLVVVLDSASSKNFITVQLTVFSASRCLKN